MRRREFLTLVGGVAAIWPLGASAQQTALPVIGLLNSNTHLDRDSIHVRAFHQGLGESGYVEGRNVEIEYHGTDDSAHLPALAADLAQRRVTVIATGGTPAALAAKAATSIIPIVFSMSVNPVEVGLVASLNRPGGNVTGVVTLNAEVGPKRLELLHELIPTATIIALLVNPVHPDNAKTVSRDLQAAAGALGLGLQVLRASSERDFDAAFASIAQVQAGGLVIGTDPLFTSHSNQLAAFANRKAMPTIYQYREFAAAGGLMSYGGSVSDSWRLLGAYTGRILKGEKPSDLPVQQSTKLDLVINLKTAKALGLKVPLTLRSRADEVIE